MSMVNEWVMQASLSLQADSTWRDSITVSGPEHPGGGGVIDIDTDRVIAQFIVWPTWAYEASALSVESGEPFHFESKPEADEQQVAEGWSRFMAALRAAADRR